MIFKLTKTVILLFATVMFSAAFDQSEISWQIMVYMVGALVSVVLLMKTLLGGG